MNHRAVVLCLLVVAFCLISARQQLCYAVDGPAPVGDECPCRRAPDRTRIRMAWAPGWKGTVSRPPHLPSSPSSRPAYCDSLPPEGPGTSRGRDFMLTLPDGWAHPEIMLIVTADVFTSGTVDIPGLSWSESFTAQPCHPAQVLIPDAVQPRGSGVVRHLGIHVTTDNDVSVCLLAGAWPSWSNDAYLALPSNILGSEYLILSYPRSHFNTGPSEFAIVGIADSTTVTITPSALTECGRPAGVPFDILLNRFDTYQLQAAEYFDLSGSEVISTQPVGVFAGNLCAFVPEGVQWCDFIVEQMTPVANWGRSFLTSGFVRPGYTRGDVLRVLASKDNTVVNFTPPVPGSPFILDRGELVEVTVAEPTEVVAQRPVLVAQFAPGGSWDDTLGDPFEMLIVPTAGFLCGYAYLTPTGWDLDYTNIIVPTGAIVSLLLDGNPVSPAIFLPIGTTGYSYGSVVVEDGCHIITADEPFGVYVYGWEWCGSYGYRGGLRLTSPIALVTGGGWIPARSDGGGDKRTFGFNAHSEGGVVWGQLQFNDHGIKMKVHSNTVNTLAVQPGDTVAGFSGHCRVDGISGYSFECEVMDRGEPGRGVDRFSIDIIDPDGHLYYSAGGVLGGGNIQIHQPDDGYVKGGPEPDAEPGAEPKPPQAKGVAMAGTSPVYSSPNPLTDNTKISFHLPSSSHATLEIYDVTGRLVSTLVDGKLNPGLHTAAWDAGDAPAGVYFYKLSAGDLTATRKMVVLK